MEELVGADLGPDEKRYLLQASTQVRRAFDLADKDKNRRLDQQELARVLRSLGVELTVEDLAEVMRRYDRNRSGAIDFREFRAVAVRQLREHRARVRIDESTLRDVFARFDRDGSRTVSQQEFAYALREDLGLDLTEEEVSALMGVLDTSGDRELEFAEFAALTKMVAEPRLDLPPAAARAVRKIARGPLPTPEDYLNAFAGLPSTFRPALTTRLARQERHSLASVLRPRVDPTSGIRFHDLLPATGSLVAPSEGQRALAEAKSLPLRRQGSAQPRPQDVAAGAAVPEFINILLDFRLATAVPVPDDAHRTGVVARFASMCLAYNPPGTRCAAKQGALRAHPRLDNPPPPTLPSPPRPPPPPAAARTCTWGTCTASLPGGPRPRRTAGTSRRGAR